MSQQALWIPGDTSGIARRPNNMVSYYRFTVDEMVSLLENRSQVLTLYQGISYPKEKIQVIRRFSQQGFACFICGEKATEVSFQRCEDSEELPHFTLYRIDQEGNYVPYVAKLLISKHYGGQKSFINTGASCSSCIQDETALPSVAMIRKIWRGSHPLHKKELSAKLPQEIRDEIEEPQLSGKLVVKSFLRDEIYEVLNLKSDRSLINIGTDDNPRNTTVVNRNPKIFSRIGFDCVICDLKGVKWGVHALAQGMRGIWLYGYNSKGEHLLLTKDHIIPKSHGGPNHAANYQTMCEICNAAKGDRVPSDLIIVEVVKRLLAEDPTFRVSHLDDHYVKVVQDADLV